MKPGRRIPTASFAPVLPVVWAMGLLDPAAVSAPPAFAQEGGGLRPWLRNLFAPPERRERIEPRVGLPGVTTGKPRTTKARKKPAVPKPAEPQVVAVEKKTDAKVVLIIGDFLGSGLAEGLSDVYAQSPDVIILDRTKGSSGFVRDDVMDWPAEIGKLIETEKPAAVIAMLGSNDRQQMRVDGNREQPRSEAWTREYTRRTEALGKAVQPSKVPFFWVAMPPFKSSKMTSDMLAFNDIYQASAEAVDGEFIDIWDGFVDENGAFVTTGPDVNGQPVKLRANDGINFTKAGKRKLAFYVEKPLAKILGTAPGAVPILAGPPPAAPGTGAPAIDTGIPISLSDPELDGGAELLGADMGTKEPPRTPGEKLAIEGIAPDPAPGRADDFSWPPKLPPVTTTGGTPDKTTAIAP